MLRRAGFHVARVDELLDDGVVPRQRLDLAVAQAVGRLSPTWPSTTWVAR